MENMEQKSPWPLALKFGLIMAFASMILHIIFYLIDPETAMRNNSSLGLVSMLIGIIISIYIFVTAAKSRRDNDLGGYMTYNKSLGFMLLIAIPAAVLVGLYTYIFYKFIDPALVEKMQDIEMEKLYEQGQSEEQVEQAMHYIRKFMTPGIMGTMSVFFIFFFLFIYALIASIFAKKTPPADTLQ